RRSPRGPRPRMQPARHRPPARAPGCPGRRGPVSASSHALRVPGPGRPALVTVARGPDVRFIEVEMDHRGAYCPHGRLTFAPLNPSDVTVSAPGRTRWPRHLPGPRLQVPPVAAGAGFGGPTMATGPEPERPGAPQPAWRTAAPHQPRRTPRQPHPAPS